MVCDNHDPPSLLCDLFCPIEMYGVWGDVPLDYSDAVWQSCGHAMAMGWSDWSRVISILYQAGGHNGQVWKYSTMHQACHYTLGPFHHSNRQTRLHCWELAIGCWDHHKPGHYCGSSLPCAQTCTQNWLSAGEKWVSDDPSVSTLEHFACHCPLQNILR